MPICHVCQGCGLDLARTLPVRDPVYSLPLVACPRCGRHAARFPRRLHPLVRGWRAFSAGCRSAFIALLSAAMFTGLATLYGYAATEIDWRLRAHDIGASAFLRDRQWPASLDDLSQRLSAFYEAGEGPYLVALLCFALICGAWIRGVLAHVPWLLACLPFILISLLLPNQHNLTRVYHAASAYGAVTFPNADEWFRATAPQAFYAPLLALGLPLGVMAARAAETRRRLRFHRLLRTTRLRRHG